MYDVLHIYVECTKNLDSGPFFLSAYIILLTFFDPFFYPTVFSLCPSHLVALPPLLAATCPLRENNTSYQSRALHSSENLTC